MMLRILSLLLQQVDIILVKYALLVKVQTALTAQ